MFDIEDQEPEPEEVLGIDESDPIDLREDLDTEESSDESDETLATIDYAVFDNVLDEFVDMFNARDLDGLGELLATDAEAGFLGESSGTGVIEGVNDLFLRYPTLLATRGDLGPEPIVLVWIFDQDLDRFDPLGYLTLDVSDAGEGQIRRVEYVDEVPDSEDLVVETPERADLPEWGDWSALDED
jgi:hypothetical protein